jgi:signal transduction histidine kinase/ActR/RegA family two-component response regulator
MKKFLAAVSTGDGRGTPRVLLFGLGLMAGAMALVIGLAAVSAFQRDESQRQVEHTLNVRQAITRTLSLLQDAETGQRGYLLTEDRAYLEPYTAAAREIGPQLNGLRQLVGDNPEQVARVDDLRTQAGAQLGLIWQSLEATRRGDRSAAVASVRDGAGKQAMDRIRMIADDMQREESRLLAQRSQADRASGDLQRSMLLAAAIGALVVGGLLFMAFRRFAIALSASHDELSAKNVELQKEIAARRETEAQLVQSQKMEAVGQLTGGLAHDFNNMLAVVISAMSLMRRRVAAGDYNIGKFIDAADEGAKRAATLTARLLAFARRQPLKPELIDPNRLVSGMSELLRRSLGGPIVVETVLAGGLWRAQVDANQLESAILNLAVNARDAMPDGGKITIETANCHLDDRYAASNVGVPAGQYVLIAVTDNGPGMPEDVRVRAFEPFFTTKPVGKGTGLGLSQVYGFVKQSNGHIKIYSEPGQGTSIKIYLPRDRTDGDLAAAGISVMAPEIPRADAVILLVEDDPHVREVTVASLREIGYTVVHASGPEMALDKLKAMPRVDLLFSDVVMPGMNGRQLADKALEMMPDLRVLFTTGYTQNAIVHNGILDANADLLTKPYSIDELAAKIAQSLAKPA